MQNLEQIEVYHCEHLEEIIGGAEASDDEVEEEAKEIVKIFPRLRNLTLQYLPELKTICSSSNVILCDSLNSIEIYKCPKLKRLPLSLHLIDGELSSPPSSLLIKIEKEWCELLEWDNHDMKMVLEPLCEFISGYDSLYSLYIFVLFETIQFVGYPFLLLLAFFLIAFSFFFGTLYTSSQ